MILPGCNWSLPASLGGGDGLLSSGSSVECKGSANCLEEVFPPQAGAAIPKVPSFTGQGRAAFDRKVEAVIARSRPD